MKQLMLIGGLTGFVLALLLGLAVPGRAMPSVFLQSCVGALVGGWLMRWWGTLWYRSLAQALLERRKAEIQAEIQRQATVKPSNRI
ncbi:MAG TPA: hypothetical protein VGH19_09930 [Verrucomicrobiae bacterium]